MGKEKFFGFLEKCCEKIGLIKPMEIKLCSYTKAGETVCVSEGQKILSRAKGQTGKVLGVRDVYRQPLYKQASGEETKLVDRVTTVTHDFPEGSRFANAGIYEFGSIKTDGGHQVYANFRGLNGKDGQLRTVKQIRDYVNLMNNEAVWRPYCQFKIN